MRLFIVAGIFFASLSTALCQTDVFQYRFDCRRYPNICKNDGTCSEKPGCKDDNTCSDDLDCTCGDLYNGFDCSNVKADFTACADGDDGGDNTDTCQNGGTCQKKTDDTISCLCPFGYYGNNCEIKLADITCEGDSASYALTFPPEFVGRVVLLNPTDLAPRDVCTFAETTDAARKIYTIGVDITDAESNAALTCKKTNLNVFEETDRTFQAKVKVFYTQNLQTTKDEYFTLNCTHNTEGGEVSIDITQVEFKEDSLNDNEQSTEYTAFVLEVTDAEGQAPSSDEPITVGDEISLDLYPRGNSGYTKVFFTSCVVNNSLEASDAVSIKILDKGCSTVNGVIVSTTQTTKVKKNEGTDEELKGVSVSFSVFKFTGDSDKIGITCLARACKEGDTKCDIPTNCAEIMKEGSTDDGTTGGDTGTDGEDTGADGGDTGTDGGADTDGNDDADTGGTRRKKRAADEENEQTISKVFRVVGSEQDKKNASTENETEEEFADPIEVCLARTEIQAMVAVLSASVCVLLIVCFILACVILRRRGKHISSYDRPVLQPKPDRFQIPRAHVNESYEIM